LPDSLVVILLGVVQGLTEFLPVSSSGHLVILQGFFGHKWLGNVLFDVSVHLGTTLAVIVYFSKDLFDLIRGLLPGSRDKNKVYIVVCLIITTAVTGTIGVLFRHSFETMFSMPALVAVMLLITGALDFLTDRKDKYTKIHRDIKFWDAVTIGIFQGIAIIPGISRSGSTIFAGVFSGLESTWAVQYSFIASIPAILGASLLECFGLSRSFSILDLEGMFVSFIVGLIALKILVWALQRHRYFLFAIYCWIIGSAYLAFGVYL